MFPNSIGLKIYRKPKVILKDTINIFIPAMFIHYKKKAAEQENKR